MADLIDRQAAVEALEKWESESIWDDYLYLHRDEPGCEPPSSVVKALPAVIPEPSQIVRDIATIIENEKDMRAIAKPRIRCVHCKRYDLHNHRCKWWNHGVSNIDWCSYAVRKDGREGDGKR